jgi:hypothetical protein
VADTHEPQVSPWGEPEDSERDGMARRRGVYLVAGSLLLVLVGAVGAKNPWALVWVEWLFHHTFIFGLLALVVFFVGLAVVFPNPVLRQVLWGVGAVVGFLWVVFSWMTAAFDEPVVETIPAPERAPYELVVRESSDGFIDAAWVFEIRQTGSPLARYWEFGCMSDDAAGDAYESARWESADRLTLVPRRGRDITIQVNPRTGEPVEPSGQPWTCQRSHRGVSQSARS